MLWQDAQALLFYTWNKYLSVTHLPLDRAWGRVQQLSTKLYLPASIVNSIFCDNCLISVITIFPVPLQGKRGAHLIVDSQHESYQGHLDTRPALRTVICWDGYIWWLKFSCLKVLGKDQQNRVKFNKGICLIKESNQATCQRTNLEEGKREANLPSLG